MEHNPLDVDIEPKYDPLSHAVREEEERRETYQPRDDESFVPWSARKPGILKKYTTNERVSISVSFMENEACKPPNAPLFPYLFYD